MGARRSIITLRGAGGNLLPEMVINLRPVHGGAFGGASRIMRGSGVLGRHGCCLIIRGGAGGVKVLHS